MARSGAHGRALIEKRQLACGIDGECADSSSRLSFEVPDFVHAEEQTAFEVELQERGIRGLRRQTQRHERNVLRYLQVVGLEAVKINTLALASCIGTRVDQRNRPGGLRHGIALRTHDNTVASLPSQKSFSDISVTARGSRSWGIGH